MKKRKFGPNRGKIGGIEEALKQTEFVIANDEAAAKERIAKINAVKHRLRGWNPIEGFEITLELTAEQVVRNAEHLNLFMVDVAYVLLNNQREILGLPPIAPENLMET